jgi:hypothetical protein
MDDGPVIGEEGFVIAPGDSTHRWVVHRPIDPYGDGYVHRMLVEVSDEGLTARSCLEVWRVVIVNGVRSPVEGFIDEEEPHTRRPRGHPSGDEAVRSE